MVVISKQSFVFVFQAGKWWETEKEVRQGLLTEPFCPTGSFPSLGDEDDTASFRLTFWTF